MGQLTDKERKIIIADYVELQSYNKVAKKHGISATTVKKWVLKDTESTQKCEQKKEENTKDILKYMDDQHETIKELLSDILKAMGIKAKKVDTFTNIKDLAYAFGIVFDKQIKIKELKQGESNPNNVNENILTIANLINNPLPNRNLEELEVEKEKTYNIM